MSEENVQPDNAVAETTPAEASATPAEASATPIEASATPIEASTSPVEGSATPAEETVAPISEAGEAENEVVSDTTVEVPASETASDEQSSATKATTVGAPLETPSEVPVENEAESQEQTATEAPAAEAPVPALAPLPVEPPALPEPAPAPALPEGHLPEPPRPLMIGAFLRLEFEIKEVLARGLTNLYRVEGGDYGATTTHIIAERDTVEDWPEIAWASSIFPAAERFTQEGRDYLIFDWDDTTTLYDFRAPSNDEDYLRCITDLAEGLAEFDSHNLTAHFSRELLRANAQGFLKFYGFPEPANETGPTALEQLTKLSGHLLKKVFAESATMRLGDEFGALAMSDEVKAFARSLNEGAFESAAQVAGVARALCPSLESQIEMALLTDVGQERALNEDAGAIFQIRRAAHLSSYEFDVFVVSDGMGGHEGGEVASDLTLTALQQALTERAGNLNWRDNVHVRAALLDIIDEVNHTVVQLTETPAYRAKRAKPGATLVFAVRLGRRVFVANVGDSRAYRWSEAGGLERISKDHSYVQSLIDQGELTEEESWDHPDGSIITANIGDPKLRYKDVFLRLFRPGDKLLLVSDGVVDMLRDSEIEVFVKANDPREIVRDLVDASNTAGGADNITALCVVFS